MHSSALQENTTETDIWSRLITSQPLFVASVLDLDLRVGRPFSAPMCSRDTYSQHTASRTVQKAENRTRRLPCNLPRSALLEFARLVAMCTRVHKRCWHTWTSVLCAPSSSLIPLRETMSVFWTTRLTTAPALPMPWIPSLRNAWRTIKDKRLATTDLRPAPDLLPRLHHT